MLSQAQEDFFHSQGYCVLPHFFSHATADALKQKMEHLIAQQEQGTLTNTRFSTRRPQHQLDQYFLDSGDKIHFFFEEQAFDNNGNLQFPLAKALNKVGHGLHLRDPLFQRFSFDARIAAICQQLGYKKPALMQSMYIFKQAGIGGEVCCHQDSSFLHGQEKEVIGFWFALEDATQDNGCLEVIPSPPSTPLSAKLIREHDRTHMITLNPPTWDETQAIPLEVPAGTLVLLHGRLPHKSCANHSKRSRHAYTLHVLDHEKTPPSTNWIRWPEGAPLL